jgi:hypothetical protein
MHLLYLSSEIYVASHIFARISIGLQENKMCVSHVEHFT